MKTGLNINSMPAAFSPCLLYYYVCGAYTDRGEVPLSCRLIAKALLLHAPLVKVMDEDVTKLTGQSGVQILYSSSTHAVPSNDLPIVLQFSSTTFTVLAHYLSRAKISY